MGRSPRNLFHNKRKKNWGLTHEHDFVVTGSKESLLEIKKQLKSIYPIKASIIRAGSEKSIKAHNRRICWGEREGYCTNTILDALTFSLPIWGSLRERQCRLQ